MRSLEATRTDDAMILLPFEVFFLNDEKSCCEIAKKENEKEETRNGALPIDHDSLGIVFQREEQEEERVVELEKLANENERHEGHETA